MASLSMFSFPFLDLAMHFFTAGRRRRVQGSTKLSLNVCNGCEKYFIMVYCCVLN